MAGRNKLILQYEKDRERQKMWVDSEHNTTNLEETEMAIVIYEDSPNHFKVRISFTPLAIPRRWDPTIFSLFAYA
jgi:hypothetical protein